LSCALAFVLQAQVFAGETAERFLSSLHVAISGERMTLVWAAPAPELKNVKEFDVKIFAHNADKKALSIKAKERNAPNREITATANKDGVITIAISDKDKTIDFSQLSSGVALTFLAANEGEWKAANFKELLHHETEQVQLLLLHPLAEMGVTIESAPDFPVAMALATTGFSEGDAQTATKVDDLIKKFNAGDDAARTQAASDLRKLYPFAIQHINKLADDAGNDQLQKCLKGVIAAHPAISAWRSYVETNKLHEDRKYLLAILKDVPLFKASARARLALLYGKDYGDDPAAWPK
jgi:hypothetical protein